MYQYDQHDHLLLAQRIEQYRDQVSRRLRGELSEEEFLPLRLQNGVYNQRHSHMLRVAIPYGTLSSVQLRALAEVADRWDRGFGHFTTRQNIQFNWVRLEDTPDILEYLAQFGVHAIQTSGNCIRNITTDVFAGVAVDEVMDPRPLAEILRQWSTLNPEFAFLPRKFKISMSGAEADRAAVRVHDIGISLYRDLAGKALLRIFVGGGLGRTPVIGSLIREALSWRDLITYTEAIIRVYNRYGRRDNKYKARIKILVQALGIETFAHEVEEEWAELRGGVATITGAEYRRVAAFFAPSHPVVEDDSAALARSSEGSHELSRWLKRNISAHKRDAYANVTLSTKPGVLSPPGDMSSTQMRAVADWADGYGSGEIRVSHDQNVVLPDVHRRNLSELWQEAERLHLATPNIGLLTDIIACPGGDFCSLANARSIPVAQAVQARFDDLDFLHDLGELSLNINGCMNACAHHHVGNIGVLGVDKNGEEWYQVMLGGRGGCDAALGRVLGPAVRGEDVPDVIEKLVNAFVQLRAGEEAFSETVTRVGLAPFKAAVYVQE